MMRGGETVKKLVLLLGLFLFAVAPSFSSAQDFPTKPINILVGYASGGTVDISSRAIAKAAEKFLGQPLILTNRAGANSGIAAGAVTKSKPDGYTLAAVTQMAFVRILQLDTVPYTLDDCVPVMYYAEPETAISVRTDSPWKTFKELVDYAKKNPWKIRFGTMGPWSLPHISMELVALKEGVQWTHIPFPGSAPAITALLGGHIEVAGTSTECVPHIKGGQLRLLATHGRSRMEDFPDIPTFRELGYDFISDTIFSFIAPKGTPLTIVRKLDETFKKAMDDPEFINTMKTMMIKISYGNYETTRRHLEEAYHVHAKRIEIFKIPKLKE